MVRLLDDVLHDRQADQGSRLRTVPLHVDAGPACRQQAELRNTRSVMASLVQVMRIVAAASVLLGCTMSRADDWPMFMHDSGHTGVSSEELQPPLRQAWEFPLGQSSAAPVVARGTAYVGNWAGEFFAVDAVARTLKWKAKTGGPICYAAAVGAGKVVVGSADGIFYAFDAQSGQQVWKHATAPDPADNA